VRIPDGTAAVSADNQGSSTKVGHWETGKAEPDWQKQHLSKRKSEDLQKEFACRPAGKGTSADEQENGCDNHWLIAAAVFYYS